jgi:hypothetical protein
MADSSKFINGKKFMWDGVAYASKEEAQGVLEKYKTDNFEVEFVEEEGNQFLVYTRRVVKEIVLDGKPPA